MRGPRGLREVRPFLDAICDAPDDDAPRLIFADWLEEHGDPQRAEFIRLQCLAESTEDDEVRWAVEARARQLVRTIGGRLVDGVPIGLPPEQFSRGLIAEIRDDAPIDWSVAPVRRLLFGSRPDSFPGPWCDRMRPGLVTDLDISLTGPIRTADLAQVLGSSAGRSIRQLSLANANPLNFELQGDATPPTALASIRELGIPTEGDRPGWQASFFRGLDRAFPALEALSLGGPPPLWGPEGTEEFDPDSLANARWIDRLEELRLHEWPYAWGAILGSGLMPRLRRLAATFEDSSPGPPDDWRACSHLEEVAIGWDRGLFDEDRLARGAAFGRLVAGLASLPRLRSLTLRGPFGSRQLELLARSAGFPALRSLHFRGFGMLTVQPLRDARWMRQLRELWISGFRRDVAIAGIEHWLVDPALGQLRRLELSDLPCSADQIDRLVTSPALQDLIELDLSGVRPGAGVVGHLTAGGLPRLGTLTLSHAFADPPGRDRLQQRFGPALVFL